MAKVVKNIVKVQVKAGRAEPKPPLGAVLGQNGVNIMEFCKEFNERTKDMGDVIVPCVITIYDDRSYEFITKQPPMTDLIKKALGIESGSAQAHKIKVGKLTRSQLEEIAKKKMPDLNTDDVDQAVKIVAGSARQMGVDTEL